MRTSHLKSLVIALTAGLGLAFVACDEPQEAEAPVEAESAQGELPEADDDAPEVGGEMADSEAPDMGDAPEGQPPGQPPAMGEQPEVDLSDEDIDQFVDAVEALNEHHEENDPEAQMADADPQEQQELMQEIMAEAQEVVEGQGLSFQEFMTISQQVQHDPELQQELGERLDIEPMEGGAPAGGGGGAPAPGGAPPAP